MERHPESFQLILSDGDGLGKITVDLESYFKFALDLSSDLQRLVDSKGMFGGSLEPSGRPFRRGLVP